MKLLIDFLPVIIFFASFQWGKRDLEQCNTLLNQILGDGLASSIPESQAALVLATLATIAASVMMILWQVARGQRIDKGQWISLVLIVAFGGATVLLHDDRFIKAKPTLFYAGMGLLLLGSRVLFKKNPLQSFMGEQLQLSRGIWDRLLLAWVLFFAIMAITNAWVAHQFDTDTWVNFKLFGTLGATLIFVVAQGIWVSRHVRTE